MHITEPESCVETTKGRKTTTSGDMMQIDHTLYIFSVYWLQSNKNAKGQCVGNSPDHQSCF